MNKKNKSKNKKIEEKNKKISEMNKKIPTLKLKTVEIYNKLFRKIKKETLGKENKDHKKELQALVDFTNWFITCTLKDPSTREIVLNVNQHKHFNQSCRKKGPNCKYKFPRFPSLKTIIAIPSRIKYKDKEEKEKQELAKSQKCLKKVKQVLEDEEFMKEAIKLRREEIENYIMHKDIVQNIDLLVEERSLTNPYPKFNGSKILNAFNEYESKDITNLDDVSTSELKQLRHYHKCQKDGIPMEEIRKERLSNILNKAEIFSIYDEEGIEKDPIELYEEALSISSQGYSVWLKRDVDEIYINMQVVLQFQFYLCLLAP